MTRRDWYIGILVLALALAFHATFPRYEYRTPTGSATVGIRIDRWTGSVEIVRVPLPQ